MNDINIINTGHRHFLYKSIYIFQNESNFKKNKLNCVSNKLISAKDILKDLTDDCKKCLQVLSHNQEFVKWAKSELKGTVNSFVCLLKKISALYNT